MQKETLAQLCRLMHSERWFQINHDTCHSVVVTGSISGYDFFFQVSLVVLVENDLQIEFLFV